jgi:hypothetical protein
MSPKIKRIAVPVPDPVPDLHSGTGTEVVPAARFFGDMRQNIEQIRILGRFPK